jgi:DNA-binding GntR family transcriptional regulator
VNPVTQEIEAETLTENTCGDSSQVDALLDQAINKVRRFYGDGAYDSRKTYITLSKRLIRAIIPPCRNAKIWRHANDVGLPLSRDRALREIRLRGRRQWKQRVGYHRRSLSETAVYRMKRCFGDHLKNRKMINQQTEARLRSKILNQFTHLGLPLFEWN